MVGIVLENIKTVNRLSYIKIHNLIFNQSFKKKQIYGIYIIDENINYNFILVKIFSNPVVNISQIYKFPHFPQSVQHVNFIFKWLNIFVLKEDLFNI